MVMRHDDRCSMMMNASWWWIDHDDGCNMMTDASWWWMHHGDGWIQELGNTGSQKSKNPGTRESRIPEIQKSRTSGIQDSRNPGAQESRIPEIQESRSNASFHAVVFFRFPLFVVFNFHNFLMVCDVSGNDPQQKPCQSVAMRVRTGLTLQGWSQSLIAIADDGTEARSGCISWRQKANLTKAEIWSWSRPDTIKHLHCASVPQACKRRWSRKVPANHWKQSKGSF